MENLNAIAKRFGLVWKTDNLEERLNLVTNIKSARFENEGLAITEELIDEKVEEIFDYLFDFQTGQLKVSNPELLLEKTGDAPTLRRIKTDLIWKMFSFVRKSIPDTTGQLVDQNGEWEFSFDFNAWEFYRYLSKGQQSKPMLDLIESEKTKKEKMELIFKPELEARYFVICTNRLVDRMKEEFAQSSISKELEKAVKVYLKTSLKESVMDAEHSN